MTTTPNRSGVASIALPWIDPLTVFAALRPPADTGPERMAVLLHSAAPSISGDGRYSYVAVDPLSVIRTATDSNDDPFAALREALAAQPPHDKGPVPFCGGAIGFFGYELRRFVERDRPRHADTLHLPDAQIGLFDTIVAFDHAERRAWAIAIELATSRRPAQRRARELADRMTGSLATVTDMVPAATWRADHDAGAYRARVAAVRSLIAAGDIYQANFTQRWLAPRPAGLDPLALYAALLRLAPAPFAAFLELGDGFSIASASPERFVSLHPGGQIMAQPIKGTRRRDPDPSRDRALADELAASEKDRAENLMIVDLLRNDLGRVAAPGSVGVPRLYQVESFSAVHHLVSTVTAELAPGAGAIDLLRAAFPGGSITGAPKIRAMQVIDQLEVARRGAYCGAIGWLGTDGAMDLSIVIRTLTITPDWIVAQAGGGIVTDSDPDDEYRECLTKARPLLRALQPDWDGDG